MQNGRPIITKSEANPTLLSSTMCMLWAAVNAVLSLETATQPEGGLSRPRRSWCSSLNVTLATVVCCDRNNHRFVIVIALSQEIIWSNLRQHLSYVHKHAHVYCATCFYFTCGRQSIWQPCTLNPTLLLLNMSTCWAVFVPEVIFSFQSVSVLEMLLKINQLITCSGNTGCLDIRHWVCGCRFDAI